MNVSYLSDALRDFASAVNALLRMDYPGEVRCLWKDKPGEYCWILERVGENVEDIESRGGNAVVRIRILEFHDCFAHQDGAAGREALVTERSVMRLATQVRGQMQQMLNEYGLDGYKECWTKHDFPTAEVDELCEWIDEAKHGRSCE